MRYLLITITLFLSIFCFGQKIKVACVGNSITYGAGIVNREKIVTRHNCKFIWEINTRFVISAVMGLLRFIKVIIPICRQKHINKR